MAQVVRLVQFHLSKGCPELNVVNSLLQAAEWSRNLATKSQSEVRGH